MKKLYLLPSILFLFLFVLNSFSYGQKFNSIVKTYDTGEKWYEGNYKDGKKEGLHKTYYSIYPYRLKSSKNYVEGQLNGLSESWDNNGNLKSSGNYKDGILIY